MESRNRLALVIGCSCLAMVTSGCSDAINAGDLEYVKAPALTQDLGPTQGNLKDKPKLQARVNQALAELYGPDPQHIRVPQGMPLTNGGYYLANYKVEGDGAAAKTKPIFQGENMEDATRQAGGYAIYRRNCVHCHGVSGAGDGPTAPFLYPVPRDYRLGRFKFTSTTTNKPPHRDDLRQTITYGLHGTSMPAFEPLLTESEIEQVIDYVMFLSMRGQTELSLIDEGSTLGDNEADVLDNETVQKVANRVFKAWRDAQSDRMNPKIARTPPTRESILRGRDLFLSSDCKDCHGRQGVGDGDNFLDMDLFNKIVFDGNPSERQERAADIIKEENSKKLWKDDWGNPLRPANLNRGIYKGGRRPIDLYWRIAKGINGAQMPAHYPSPFDDQKMWDIVNFVLALPYEPELLTDAPPPPAAGTAVAAAGGN